MNSQTMSCLGFLPWILNFLFWTGRAEMNGQPMFCFAVFPEAVRILVISSAS